jgi:hypothetical protein
MDARSDAGPDAAADAGAAGPDAADGGMDALPTPDTGQDDTGAGPGDGGAGDIGPADSGPPDAGFACPNTLNLNQVGTASQAGMQYLGGNRAAPDNPQFPLPVRCSIGGVGREVAFTYTPTQATTSRLLVSTDWSDTTFDTILWVIDGCTSNDPVLACNDDSQTAPVPVASTVTIAATPGHPVAIVVGGLRDLMSGKTSTGAFRLSVNEQQAINVGGPCDANSLTTYCAAGSACTTTACIADGALYGRCRETGNPCDPGYGCTLNVHNANARCMPALANGIDCDPYHQNDVCTPPLQCETTNRSACDTPTYTVQTATIAFIDACAMGQTEMFPPGTGSWENTHTAASVSIGFDVPFFTEVYTDLWPDTNGYFVFGTDPPMDANDGYLPSMFESGAAVGALWEDMILSDGFGYVCTYTAGNAPHRMFVVEWYGAAPFFSSDGAVDAEVVLHETSGTIDLLYDRLEGFEHYAVDGTIAAIGLQEQGPSLVYVYEGSVAPRTGLTFKRVH